jgi:hemolysin activation/secretion protein
MTPSSRLSALAAAAAACLLLSAPALHAQTAPDAGKLLRDSERAPAANLPPAVPAPGVAQPAPESGAGPRVQVSAFRLSGVSLLPEAELQARLAPFIAQPASLSDLRRAADAVAAAYRERGFLVRAYLAEQELQGGVVTITVLEGRLAALRIDRPAPGRHISDAQVRATMTARQKIGAPVRADDIERAIGLLNALPGVSASSLLEPGDHPGESRLVVAVKDEPAVTGQLQIDNAGAKASGEWRASGGLSLNSPLGRGDQVQFYASKSRGSNYGSATCTAPLGHDGLRASANVSRLDYGYDLAASRYTGAATVLGAGLSYPLLRSQGLNLNAGISHDRKAFNNAVAGIQLNDKTVALSGLGLNGDAADGWLGGGLNQFSLLLGFGRLDLGGNAADLGADQATGGPQRQGSFQKTAWSLSRLQRIGDADTLAVTLAGQRASRNLDSAEKFGATGTGGLRAYSSAEPSADDGSLFSLEWRHQFSDSLQVSAFHEQARLQRDHGSNSATLAPNSYSLAGNGLGLSWGRASSLLMRATLAWRQGENPVRNLGTGADSDGTHRNPRALVSLLKIF